MHLHSAKFLGFTVVVKKRKILVCFRNLMCQMKKMLRNRSLLQLIALLKLLSVQIATERNVQTDRFATIAMLRL